MTEVSSSASAAAARANADAHLSALCALVLGGGGFIGLTVCAALRRAGWRVVRVVRPGGARGDDVRACDLAGMSEAEAWMPLLDGVDAVVNCAGILRETHRDKFDLIHKDMPLALAQACLRCGITRFVQVSALGSPQDGEFVASKHRFDEALLECMPSALVLRPSVTYSTSGSYGGTSLLRALAAMPVVMPLPGKQDLMLQPLATEDLAGLVVSGLARGCRGLYEVGGPEPMTLHSYQLRWRRWLGTQGDRFWHVPASWINALTAIGERLGRGPMGSVAWRMLRRGNVTGPDAHARLAADFGRAPRELDVVLAARPSAVQDRWHAQLYWLVEPLKFGVVALWLLSALAGWITPAGDIERLTAGSWLANMAPVLLARVTAGLDLVLALWLALSRRPRFVIALMALSVLAYTLVLGSAVPALWLDPLGGMAKNLVILPALAVLWVVVERR